MRRLWLLLPLFLALLFAFPASAQNTSVQSFQIMGTAPVTAKVTVTDASVLLTAAFTTAHGSAPNWDHVQSVLITCEDYDARISFTTAAAQGGSPMGHIIAVGNSMRLPSRDMIRKAYIINKTNSAASHLMVTLEF